MRKILMMAMLAAGIQTASAADMPDYPLRGGYTEIGVGRPTWEGFYVGGQASQAWLRTKDTSNYNSDIQAAYAARTGLAPGSFVLPPAVEGRKAAYGGFVGYNSQWEDVVVGVEANYLHSDVATNAIATSLPLDPIQARSTLNVALKDFGSLRLRGGYMLGNFLPYAFVGFAGGNADVTRSAGVISNGRVPVNVPFETSQKNLFVYGYSAGVGIDALIIGGLFARAEYEYTQFTSSKLNASVNTVKVGLGYKF